MSASCSGEFLALWVNMQLMSAYTFKVSATSLSSFYMFVIICVKAYIILIITCLSYVMFSCQA